MNNTKIQPKPLSVKELLDDGSCYRIPMYQRNYAWEEAEISQLIQDITDYCLKDKPQPYYIGTLVVYKKEENGNTVYETIDGQQRLTTLSLLISYLNNNDALPENETKNIKIDFECRIRSQKTLEAVFEKKHTTLPENKTNYAILNGYNIIERVLPSILKENNSLRDDFSQYLRENVKIMRVEVPKDTDLNHYFEIMNNRGEQLEKHEILKSRMMEVLKGDNEESQKNQNCLHVVWEACSNMEKYVQMGFTPEQRKKVFSENRLLVDGFDGLCKVLFPCNNNTSQSEGEKSESKPPTIRNIINSPGGYDKKTTQSDSNPEKFNSIINFPNFLLHVLRVQTKQDIPLDDKRLIETFETHLLKSDDAVEKVNRVKKFTFALFRCKFLYDQYVIKREFSKETDGWSLKRLKWNDNGGYYVNTFGADDEVEDEKTLEENKGINRRILMLLSAFHVSNPSQNYKYWLNAALRYLFTNTNVISADGYLAHLESVAKAFVFDRFLAPNGGLDYFDIIYNNNGICKKQREGVSEECMKKKLSFGNIENNFVFNFLDYRLWLENEQKEKKDKDDKITKFTFTFRSSVEHYYPRQPSRGHAPLPLDTLNSFGNLCLISHSKNSRLSNFMPKEKKEPYEKAPTIDSIKQHLMMQYDKWDTDAINDHCQKMKGVFLEAIGVNIFSTIK